MSDTTSKLEVTVFSDAASINSEDGGMTFEVNYVSLVTNETHGAPALVAPGRENGRETRPTAKTGDRVLYINTSFIPAWEIERKA